MKRIFILLIIAFSYNKAVSQSGDSKINFDSLFIQEADSNYKKIKNSLLATKIDLDSQFVTNSSAVLDPLIFNKFLDQKFSYLSYERGALPSVNSASLDLLDNETQLKLSLAKKISDPQGQIRKIISLGVKAKLGDGISNLFKGNSISTGTNLFLNFAFLNKTTFRTILSRQKNNIFIPTPFGILKPRLKKLLDGFYLKNVYSHDEK